ncbi:MAG: GHKL domain-containing protein [Ruminococcaceae bacterium]|nr:GHKL domain-containing protein [Oscillospiraceae bacterium]
MTIFKMTFVAFLSLIYISAFYSFFYLFTLERKPKFKFWPSFVILFLSNSIYTYCASFIHELLAVRSVLMLIVEIVFICIIFKDSFIKKLFTAILSNLVCIFSEMLAVAIYAAVFGVEALNTTSVAIQILLFVCYILSFAIMTYSVRSVKSEGSRREQIKLISVIALFFITCVSILMVFGNPTYIHTVSKQTVWFLAAGVLASLGSVVLVISLMNGISKSKQIEYENALLLKQTENQTAHYETLVEHQQQIRVLRHDIVNHITTVSELFARGNAEESKKYADEVLEQYRSISHVDYCHHLVADAILTAKASLMAEKGIKFSCNAAIPKSLPIDNISIVCVISNLLDNAINAAELAKDEKHIDFSARVASSCLFIKAINSYSPDSVTVKKNIQLHGLGTGIIENVAKKHNGSFERIMNDGICTVTCSIPFSEC